MFKKNKRHLQPPLISQVSQLPEQQFSRLERSWAGVFYREVFYRLDESDFAGVTAHNAKFSVSALRGFDFSNADLTGSSFEVIDAREANFDGANLTDCNFSVTDLKDASFRKSTLVRIPLSVSGQGAKSWM